MSTFIAHCTLVVEANNKHHAKKLIGYIEQHVPISWGLSITEIENIVQDVDEPIKDEQSWDGPTNYPGHPIQ